MNLITEMTIGAGEIVLFVIIGICLVIFLVFAIRRSIRVHRQQVAAGREEMVGRRAVVKEILNPRGTVLVEGERWTAELKSGQAEPEEEVIITGFDSLKLFVEKKSEGGK